MALNEGCQRGPRSRGLKEVKELATQLSGRSVPGRGVGQCRGPWVELCAEGKGLGGEPPGARGGLAGHCKGFSQNEEIFDYNPIF